MSSLTLLPNTRGTEPAGPAQPETITPQAQLAPGGITGPTLSAPPRKPKGKANGKLPASNGKVTAMPHVDYIGIVRQHAIKAGDGTPAHLGTLKALTGKQFAAVLAEVRSKLGYAKKDEALPANVVESIRSAEKAVRREAFVRAEAEVFIAQARKVGWHDGGYSNISTTRTKELVELELQVKHAQWFTKQANRKIADLVEESEEAGSQAEREEIKIKIDSATASLKRSKERLAIVKANLSELEAKIKKAA